MLTVSMRSRSWIQRIISGGKQSFKNKNAMHGLRNTITSRESFNGRGRHTTVPCSHSSDYYRRCSHMTKPNILD